MPGWGRAVGCCAVSGRSGIDQVEAFIEPSDLAADHLLDGATQPGEPRAGLVCGVAMRPGAIHDEEGVEGVAGHALFGDCRMVQKLGTWHVCRVETCLTTEHVEQHEVRIAARHRFMDVPAVGLDGEQTFEMARRVGG